MSSQGLIEGVKWIQQSTSVKGVYIPFVKTSFSTRSIHHPSDCAKTTGYRDDSAVYGTGYYGNYWSSTPNDKNNAYNLNFNSNNVNVNNNRNNGYSVRLVRASIASCFFFYDICGLEGPFFCTMDLMEDLYQAYLDARHHKRRTRSQILFEMHLEDNLAGLFRDLSNGIYNP